MVNVMCSNKHMFIVVIGVVISHQKPGQYYIRVYPDLWGEGMI